MKHKSLHFSVLLLLLAATQLAVTGDLFTPAASLE